MDKAIDEQSALAVIQLIMGQASSHSDATLDKGGASGPPLKPRGRASLRELVDASGAKNIAAQIVAIAEFLRRNEGKDEFTRDEVGSRFKQAGLAPPKNLGRDFQTAVGKGWISEDSKQAGQFFITGTGEKAIANKFEGTRASSSRAPRKKKRKDAKPKK